MTFTEEEAEIFQRAELKEDQREAVSSGYYRATTFTNSHPLSFSA